MIAKKGKTRRAIRNKYAFGTYKPNKNCKPVTYKGTEYLSKVQCMALEGITRKELEEYLQGRINEALEDQEMIPDEKVEPMDVFL